MIHGLRKLETGIWLSGLMKTGKLTNSKVRRIFDELGCWENLYEVKPETIIGILGTSEEKAKVAEYYIKSAEERDKAASEAKRCHGLFGNGSFKCHFINEDEYPYKLKEISSAPAILYCCSDMDISIMNTSLCIAVVGTRRPTYYGTKVTENIISGLKGTKSVIISGMARGIDTLAHIAAIKSGIPTAAIIGCGADIAYPPENFDLMKQIITSGLILSECAPGTRPFRSYFPARNRLISGSSDCVVVTEASEDSGTMITSNFAGDQGRDVFAVPGSVFSPNSSGTNKLIKDGAYVITSSRDIIDNYRYDIKRLEKEENILSGRTELHNKYPEKLKKITDILTNYQMSFDELASVSDLSTSKLAELLSEGEISGYIGFEKGRYFLT